jgi:hypothetical protein
MELENVNTNGNNVLPSNLNNTKLSLFLKIVKIELKNKHYMFSFPKDVIIAWKKFLILFTSLINVKWTKAFLVDMNLFHKKYKIISFFEVLFSVSIAAQTIGKNHLGQHKFFSKDPIEKESCPWKASIFLHLQGQWSFRG